MKHLVKAVRTARIKHRRILLINLPAVLAYFLSIVSVVLLLVAVVLGAVLLNSAPVQHAYIDGSAPPSQEVSAAMRLAIYGVTGLVALLCLTILAVALYYLIRLYALGMKRLMRVLKLPQTLRQLVLLKAVVFTLPILCFSVATLVMPQITLLTATLMVCTLVCCVAAVLLATLHGVVAKRSRLALAQAW